MEEEEDEAMASGELTCWILGCSRPTQRTAEGIEGSGSVCVGVFKVKQ